MVSVGVPPNYWFYTQSAGVDGGLTGTCAAVNTVAVTYTGSLFRCYVNASLVRTMGVVINISPYGYNAIVGDTSLGLGMPEEHWNGDIYGAVVHDYAFSAGSLDTISAALRVP